MKNKIPVIEDKISYTKFDMIKLSTAYCNYILELQDSVLQDRANYHWGKMAEGILKCH